MKFKNTLYNSAFPIKNKFLPLESIDPKGVYAFTISPSQQFQFKHEGIRLPKFITHMKDLFIKLFGTIKYKMYLEISTNNQNYHYHGIIQFINYSNIISFYDQLPKFQDDYSMELDTVEQQWIWYVYTHKQRHIMEPECHRLKQPYKLKNLKIPKEARAQEGDPLDKI